MPSDRMFQVVYKTIDDCEITTDIYVPGLSNITDNGTKKQLPTIIILHGGAFMLGHSRMNSQLQITDCLSRGWLVVAPDHRLCPQVDIFDGPMADCRDLLAWIHNGSLDKSLSSHNYINITVNLTKIIAMGTSSGGHLAHSLAFNTPTPPVAILDFYGAKNFSHEFWTKPLPFITPPPCTPEMSETVYSTTPIPTRGGISLEGQRGPPPADDPRHLFAMNAISSGTVISTCYPSGKPSDPSTFKPIDPLLNITPSYPPTCIVHGLEDKMVPAQCSSLPMIKRLEEKGVQCQFIGVEGEGHTFAGKMEKGTKTWEVSRGGFDWVEGIVNR